THPGDRAVRHLRARGRTQRASAAELEHAGAARPHVTGNRSEIGLARERRGSFVPVRDLLGRGDRLTQTRGDAAGRAFIAAHAGRPAGVGFRPIVESDLPFLFDLYASTREAELAPVPWPPEAKRAFLAQQFNAQHAYYHQIYADADFLLILRDAVPIGRIYV